MPTIRETKTPDQLAPNDVFYWTGENYIVLEPPQRDGNDWYVYCQVLGGHNMTLVFLHDEEINVTTNLPGLGRGPGT